MQKSNKLKSTVRKSLIDGSNSGKSSRVSSKKKCSSNNIDAGALDRLLLVRSELSNLFGQIEELVAEALSHTLIDSKAIRDIESFTKVLQDMQSTLKPWVTKFRHSLASTAPRQPNKTLPTQTACTSIVRNEDNVAPSKSKTEVDLRVSPSPLVSWRVSGDSSKIEAGKQLFLLTPLSKLKHAPSRNLGTSKTSARTNHENASKQKIKKDSILAESKKDPPPTLTPCLKKAPGNIPKQPTQCPNTNINKFSSNDVALKDPRHTSENILENPTHCHNSNNSNEVSSRYDVALKDLISRYQDSVGKQPNENKCVNRRRDLDWTFDWFLSPPKTCVIMEPSDDPTPIVNGVSSMVRATPLFKGIESTIIKGKKAGETTLKRELWARFEEASEDEVHLHFDKPDFQKPTKKGFMDMLEEACESECLDLR